MKQLEDKFDLMQEKDIKIKDKNRDFIKSEGLTFLGNLKYFNSKLDQQEDKNAAAGGA